MSEKLRRAVERMVGQLGAAMAEKIDDAFLGDCPAPENAPPQDKMSDPLRHFDNLICISEFVPMSDERKEMLRQAASELARLRLTEAEREAVERAADWLDRWQQTHGYHSSESGDLATLRGLLERVGGGK